MVVRRQKQKGNKALRYIRTIILVLLFVVGISFLLVCTSRAVIYFSQKDNIVTSDAIVAAFENDPVDGIVVLGAGVYRDGSLSPMLKNRLDKAIEIYQKGASKKILCTGDHRVGEYDEVDHMVEYLVVNNIPEENIVFDYNGQSTAESMTNAARTFGLKRIIVITQQYHLYRAMYLGATFDMEVYGIAAENAGDFFGKLYRTMREEVASVKDLVYCLIQN